MVFIIMLFCKHETARQIIYVTQGNRLDISKNEILHNLSTKTLHPRHKNSSIKVPTHGLSTIHRTLPAMQIFINIRRTSSPKVMTFFRVHNFCIYELMCKTECGYVDNVSCSIYDALDYL
ncbi:hypothetical protein RYX36_020088, partial [Vicia faba]